MMHQWVWRDIIPQPWIAVCEARALCEILQASLLLLCVLSWLGFVAAALRPPDAVPCCYRISKLNW